MKGSRLLPSLNGLRHILRRPGSSSLLLLKISSTPLFQAVTLRSSLRIFFFFSPSVLAFVLSLCRFPLFLTFSSRCFSFWRPLIAGLTPLPPVPLCFVVERSSRDAPFLPFFCSLSRSFPPPCPSFPGPFLFFSHFFFLWGGFWFSCFCTRESRVVFSLVTSPFFFLSGPLL